MSEVLSAGAPVGAGAFPVGHREVRLGARHRPTDHGPAELVAAVWYPALHDGGQRVSYEVLPGVSFAAAAAQPGAPVARRRFPLVVFSHGRTGTRSNYTMLCEALAALGLVVVSADHRGDTLTDWLSGAFADDRTNEVGRVGDAHALIDAFSGASPGVDDELLGIVDGARIAVVGHSYGAYTGLATVAGARGTAPHPLVRAVVGLQPYTRTLSDNALRRVAVPTLLVASELDRTTPAATDVDRPVELLAGRPLWSYRLEGAGHQASSDIGLYADLIESAEGIPDAVRAFFPVYAADSIGPGLRPWRSLIAEQLDVVGAFLGEVLAAAHLGNGADLVGSAQCRVEPV